MFLSKVISGNVIFFTFSAFPFFRNKVFLNYLPGVMEKWEAYTSNTGHFHMHVC